VVHFRYAQAVTKQAPNGCVPSHALASANSQSVYPADRQLADFISALPKKSSSLASRGNTCIGFGVRFVLHDDPGSDYRMAYDALFSRSSPRFSCDRGEQEKNSGKNSRWRYQDPAGRICPIGNLFWFVDRAAMSS
jgi:hypothetical protein